MTAPYKAAALEPQASGPIVLALPKGRILAECGDLLARRRHPSGGRLCR